jgi:xanthine/CO dehydrogenase XdhC/CoxF family maturation factor
MVTSASGTGRVAARMAELIAARVPFVHATVVRAQCPTSAHPGDAALVLADGTFEGFVGGQCAEGSVRTASLDVLASGSASAATASAIGDVPTTARSGAGSSGSRKISTAPPDRHGFTTVRAPGSNVSG